MNKKLFRLELIGFIFVSITGTILHFVYGWSANNKIVGLISPVNESPWEHLKLIFFPYLFYMIFEQKKLNQDKFNIQFSKYIGVLCGMMTIIIIYYTVNGCIGYDLPIINIMSFFIGTAIAFLISYTLINMSIGNGIPNGIGTAMLIITTITFFIFTFAPPYIALFIDPSI